MTTVACLLNLTEDQVHALAVQYDRIACGACIGEGEHEIHIWLLHERPVTKPAARPWWQRMKWLGGRT